LTALFAQRKKAEVSLRESERRLAKERAMLASLHDVGSRLWLKRDLCRALDQILAGAIQLLGADMGIIQILDSARNVLKIEAHRGFNQDFLDSFSKVSAAADSVCGKALRSGERIVIADVEADKILAPFRRLARAGGFARFSQHKRWSRWERCCFEATRKSLTPTSRTTCTPLHNAPPTHEE
jgi:hypothetical protein